MLNEYFPSVLLRGRSWRLRNYRNGSNVLEDIEMDKSTVMLTRNCRKALPSSRGDVLGYWWVANVVSFFKNGCKEKRGKERPVSRAPVVWKLLEGSLRDRIHCGKTRTDSGESA